MPIGALPSGYLTSIIIGEEYFASFRSEGEADVCAGRKAGC